jgi:hypothetical protein
MFLGNDPITEESMIGALDTLTEGKKDTTVFFRADKTVDYETMMKVMDTLHQAGYLKIGLVGEETVKRNNPPDDVSQAGHAPAFFMPDAAAGGCNRHGGLRYNGELLLTHRILWNAFWKMLCTPRAGCWRRFILVFRSG